MEKIQKYESSICSKINKLFKFSLYSFTDSEINNDANFYINHSLIENAGDGLFTKLYFGKDTTIKISLELGIKINDIIKFNDLPIIGGKIDFNKLEKLYNNYLNISSKHVNIIDKYFFNDET